MTITASAAALLAKSRAIHQFSQKNPCVGERWMSDRMMMRPMGVTFPGSRYIRKVLCQPHERGIAPGKWAERRIRIVKSSISARDRGCRTWVSFRDLVEMRFREAERRLEFSIERRPVHGVGKKSHSSASVGQPRASVIGEAAPRLRGERQALQPPPQLQLPLSSACKGSAARHRREQRERRQRRPSRPSNACRGHRLCGRRSLVGATGWKAAVPPPAKKA